MLPFYDSKQHGERDRFCTTIDFESGVLQRAPIIHVFAKNHKCLKIGGVSSKPFGMNEKKGNIVLFVNHVPQDVYSALKKYGKENGLKYKIGVMKDIRNAKKKKHEEG